MRDKMNFGVIIGLVVVAVLTTVLGVIIGLATNPAPTTIRFTATAVVAQVPPPTTPPTRPSRNNGGPCDPNTPPPSLPARNAGINANPPQAQVTVTISKSQHPETAAHIEAAQAAGHPRYLTIDQDDKRIDTRRRQATSICPTIPTWQRDEYPPAMFEEGGQGASVRYVEPGDNGGAGVRIKNLLTKYPNGTIVEIKVVP